MPRISRNWITPLTIAVFLLMAVTGSLMFFHLDSELQKTLHEWMGWLMVTAVAGHAIANWAGLKRYLQFPSKSLAAVALSAALVGGTFVMARSAENAPPPIVALRAVSNASLQTVAPLAGKSVAQARRDLARAGFAVANDDASLMQIAGGDREKMAVAMNALFQPAP